MLLKVVPCLFLPLLLSSTWATYTPNVVNELTSSNFTTEVLHDKSVWFIEFYSPGCVPCRETLRELKKLAKMTDGKFKVGKADAATDEDLFDYAVDGYPTLRIFGDDKGNPTIFDGDRTAEIMKEAILKEIGNNTVSPSSSSNPEIVKEVVSKEIEKNTVATYTPNVVNELTSSNFTTEVLHDKSVWFIQFYAPWCGPCHAMLPELEKLANMTDGKFKVGKANADTDGDLFDYIVVGYPTLRIFGDDKGNPTEFNGDRTAEIMKEAILKEIGNNTISSSFASEPDFDWINDFRELIGLKKLRIEIIANL